MIIKLVFCTRDHQAHRSSSTVMEDSKQSEAFSLEQFKQIMGKLFRLDNQM